MESPTPEPLDAVHESAWRAYLRAHALLQRALDAELRRESGISLNTFDALVQLSEAPDRQMRMNQLAAALVYSQSGLTRVADGLEKAGFAIRSADPGDRRALLVRLTDAGLAALEAAWPVHLRGVQAYWAKHLSAREAETVARVFGRVRHDLEPPS